MRAQTLPGLVLLASVAMSCGTTPPRLPAPGAAARESARLPRVLLRKARAGSGGVGTLAARSADGKSAVLALSALQVEVRLAGEMAETAVDHRFFNPGSERMEGSFRFPLPDGAILIGLAMEIDGKLQEGELVEREKARRTYEAIVDAMQDPALLEWEQGSTFKLRVFPIEPRAEKRVVIRYLMPLRREAGEWRFQVGTAAPGLDLATTIGRFSLALEGETLLTRRAFPVGQEVSVAVPGAKAPAAVQREARADATYLAVKLRPAWRELHPASVADARPRALVAIVDTSRSSLESARLAQQSLRKVLESLGSSDRFLVLACDLECRSHAPGLAPASASQVASALRFVAGIEPDGASDLGAAFRAAGRALRQAGPGSSAQLLYLGDGVATWGETEPAALRRALRENLGTELAFFPVLLGRGAESALLGGIAGELGGRALRPRSPAELEPLVALLATPAAPRLRGIELDAGARAQIAPAGPLTVFAGDEPTVLIRIPKGAPVPAALRVRGYVGRRAAGFALALASPQRARGLARRWAAARIAALEADGGAKAEIVALSLEHGVLSRHTALLVLESEQAYREHQIARRAKEREQAAAPRVTGGDLESLGAPRASVSPSEMQPGDPEIRIPAPADARSVTVVFPFGETKLARYEPALRAWTVRFLIDKATPDGRYPVLIRIALRDGGAQLLTLHYTVDTRAPTVALSLHRTARADRYELRARQEVSPLELKLKGGGDAGLGEATLVHDARRVEVQLPDGRVLSLARVAGAEGRFATVFGARSPLQGSLTVRVVATDRALNRRVFTVTLPVPEVRR